MRSKPAKAGRKEPSRWIIGGDLHTRYQQVAAWDTRRSQLLEQRLEHGGDQVRQFYAGLPRPARVGIEATGGWQWFEQLLEELGHELWVGNAAAIRASMIRQQKTDRREARHLWELLESGRFPRLWVPSPAERDLRQLRLPRHKRVERRTAVRNQWQALARSQGVCRRQGRWSEKGRRELAALSLPPWAAGRRQDLLSELEQLAGRLGELNPPVEPQAAGRADVARRRTHPGVGPVTALAFVLTIGPIAGFRRSKQLISYVGLNPREHSSGGRQCLGRISKQGNRLLRGLLGEAAHSAARLDPELESLYRPLVYRRGRGVAVARKLAVRRYWRQRRQVPSQELMRMRGSPVDVVVPATGSVC